MDFTINKSKRLKMTLDYKTERPINIIIYRLSKKGKCIYAN